MRRLLIVIILFTLFGQLSLFSQTQTVYAQDSGCPAVNITDNGLWAGLAQIDGNYVVWVSTDGNDSEIWLYDISTGNPHSIFLMIMTKTIIQQSMVIT